MANEQALTYFGENFYPDGMEFAFMCRAPYYVNMGWSAVSPLLSANTKAGIKITTMKRPPQMAECMDEEDLDDILATL